MTMNKRALTTELKDANAAADASPVAPDVSDDLRARLRAVGARTRKNVTEGYRTTPTFMRAQTTNAIFCSANDTLREIYANQPVASSSDTERKRSRSITALDTPPESVSRDEVQQETPLCDDKAARLVKPLKRPMRSAKLTHTQSLPASMFTSPTPFAPSHGQVNEEPDWSEDAFNPVAVSDKGFGPMTLDP